MLPVGGVCGQEPCKQMSADDDHAGYLQHMKATDQSTNTVSSFVCFGSRLKTLPDYKYMCVITPYVLNFLNYRQMGSVLS